MSTIPIIKNESNSKEKPYLIILPGWMHNRNNWSHVLSMFAQDFSTFFIDLPGFGIERYDPTLLTVKDYAEWTKKAIAGLKLKGQIVLLGHSFGGRIATEIAAEKPKWLHNLVLYGAPVLYRPNQQIKVINKLVQIKKKIIGEKSLGLLQSDDYKQAKNTEMANIFTTNVRYDQTDLVSKISVPTLLLWGQNDDQARLSIAKELLKLIPSSKLEILKSLGHNAYLENPNLFYGYVKKFIQNN